jgi:N,N'-diacetyllegionaminate synthase
MIISMGSRNVGQGTPVYIVFEAGPTHTGLNSAKKLANLAKEAGADAIKFQITDHNRLITTKDIPFSYGILTDRQTEKIETITEPLIDIWKRRYMPREDWRLVKEYCDELRLDFFATIFFPEDVDFMLELGVHSLKIASQDIGYQDLIVYAAKKGVPVQLDTGNATIGEVERAVDWIRDQGNDQIIINHCPSGYPARLESINLNVVSTLKKMFPYPVAFSDHTPGWEMDIAARSVGADMIEKTVTLDRETRSCEHVMSLEPPEMKNFVDSLRRIDIALGDSRRIITEEQRNAAMGVIRSGFMTRDVKAGALLSRDDFDFRRPGYGVVRPDSYQHHLNRKFARDLRSGNMIREEDLV